MYNAKQKKKFISWIADSYSYADKCVEFFEKISMIEAYFGKDICDMSSDELEPMQNIFYGNITAQRIINKYSAWCVHNNIIQLDAPIFNLSFVSHSKKNISNVEKAMFSSPSHLADEIDAVFGTIYKNTENKIYRCYLSMIYCLVPYSIMAAVVGRNVKQDGEMIEYDNIVYFIYKELSGYITDAISKPDIPLFYTGRAVPTVENIQNGMKKFLDNRGIEFNTKNFSERFNPDSVMLSGIYYKAITREMVGMPVDIMRIARPLLSSISSQAEKRIVDNYEEWKSMFYPDV